MCHVRLILKRALLSEVPHTEKWNIVNEVKQITKPQGPGKTIS